MLHDHNDAAFIALFKDTCRVGLGYELTVPLTEIDSKVLAATILTQTGLVVGSKSLKNYSLYVLGRAESKKENPSVATLDTLARLVLQAPCTNEGQRKTYESHYPYWFKYRNQRATEPITTEPAVPGPSLLSVPRLRRVLLLMGALLVAFGLWQGHGLLLSRPSIDFVDSFTHTAADSLHARGWTIQHADTTWWPKHSNRPGYLTLYTIPGDNWPSAARSVALSNLLVRRVEAECFAAEIHFDHFFPMYNWQQAGLLLSENEAFSGKLLRLSLSYNDYFGGYSRPPEILIQVLSSTEADSRSKPEEFAHLPLFALQRCDDTLVAANLTKSALKIEKKGHQFRFLYATGSMESFAFKEVARGTFAIEPRYVGLFAIQGTVSTPSIAPVYLDSFKLIKLPCE